MPSAKNLEKIKLPPGFKIDLYAIVPDARHMAVGPHRRGLRRHAQEQRLGGDRPQQGRRRRRGEAVRAVARFDDSRTASASRRTASSIVAEQQPRAASSRPPSSSTRARTSRSSRSCQAGRADSRRRGELQPHRARLPDRRRTTSSTSRSASRSTCRRKDKLALYKKPGIGGIVRMDQDGKNREVYATGMRNSVGMDFNPERQGRSGSPTTRPTAWATTSRRASSTASPRRASISASPSTAAAQVRTIEYKDERAAGRRDVPAGRDGSRTRPISA